MVRVGVGLLWDLQFPHTQSRWLASRGQVLPIRRELTKQPNIIHTCQYTSSWWHLNSKLFMSWVSFFEAPWTLSYIVKSSSRPGCHSFYIICLALACVNRDSNRLGSKWSIYLWHNAKTSLKTSRELLSMIFSDDSSSSSGCIVIIKWVARLCILSLSNYHTQQALPKHIGWINLRSTSTALMVSFCCSKCRYFCSIRMSWIWCCTWSSKFSLFMNSKVSSHLPSKMKVRNF